MIHVRRRNLAQRATISSLAKSVRSLDNASRVGNSLTMNRINKLTMFNNTLFPAF